MKKGEALSLPKGWVEKKLIDIADVSTGKYDANHANVNGKYRFYTCAYNYGMCTTNRFSGESLILPGNGVNVGEVFYYNSEFDAYQRTYVINNIKIFPKYLHYHMLLFWKLKGTKLQYGSATNFIKIGNFQNYDVSYPPLPEQQRIVAILDDAFTKIEKAKANAEQNLKNAKELFESYLQGVFDPSTRSGQGNKGDDWEEKNLNEISENLDSKRVPITKSIRNEGSIPYYGASGIVDYVADYIFNEDLLCISEDGANLLARTYPIAFSISGKTWVNNHAHVLRFKTMVSQKFIELYLNSIKLDDFVSGMAQPKLNQKMLNKIPIPFPSIKVQEKIVSKSDALSFETKKLVDIYKQKIKDLEELKKSVLQKAFSGEL